MNSNETGVRTQACKVNQQISERQLFTCTLWGLSSMTLRIHKAKGESVVTKSTLYSNSDKRVMFESLTWRQAISLFSTTPWFMMVLIMLHHSTINKSAHKMFSAS